MGWGGCAALRGGGAAGGRPKSWGRCGTSSGYMLFGTMRNSPDALQVAEQGLVEGVHELLRVARCAEVRHRDGGALPLCELDENVALLRRWRAGHEKRRE